MGNSDKLLCKKHIIARKGERTIFMVNNVNLDAFEKTFSSYEEMCEFHRIEADASEWRKAKIGELFAFPLTEEPDTGIVVNGVVCDPTVSPESLVDTTKNTRIGLKATLLPVFEGEGLFRNVVAEEREVCFPVRDSAMKSIFERAKISGYSLSKLSPSDLCFVLNRCFELYHQAETLVLIRDEKITACHSGEKNCYSVLRIDELLNTLLEGLEEKFGQVSFVSGYTSHSFTRAEFKLVSAQKALLGNYSNKLKSVGYTNCADNLVPAIQFSTSDTGNSCARCTACLEGNGTKINIGSTLEVEHKGKASVVGFGSKVEQLFSQFEKSVLKLQKLLDIQISHPISCMERVCKALKLPKKASLEAIQMFEFANGDEPCTAHDIYIAMQEIPFLYRTSGDSKVSEFALFNCEENVARALSIDWDKYDIMRRIEW